MSLRDEMEKPDAPFLVSGCVGPRGDGYQATALMSADEAQAYHSIQIATFAETRADLVTAMTMNSISEALGIVKAAIESKIPVAISFTVETDGRLPTGETLEEAILRIDDATHGAPAYYMINCAHPTHSRGVLSHGAWMQRLKGVRVNASTCSHAELDAADMLDDGNPIELGREVANLKAMFPDLTILGGCCGTDHRHIEEIARFVVGGRT